MLMELAACVMCLARAQAADAPDFLKGFVADEQGFPGAVRVAELSVEGDMGCVTVDIPYLDVHGEPKMGQGRLMVRRQEVESGQPLPAFCHVHYELGLAGAKKWCEEGWAVFTGHYAPKDKGGYPLELCIGDSNNLARALIQWVRRLPFIDRTRLHLDGGSAGGYMALAMSADMFPVTSTTANLPVVNWAYNFGYFEANKACAKYGEVTWKDSPLPLMSMVTKLADQAYEVFGHDLSVDAWYLVSPIAYLDRIANPASVICSTGDMLVPHAQMTRRFPRPFDPGLFPECYTRDFDAVTHAARARRRFDEVIPKEKLDVRLVPKHEGLPEFTRAQIMGEEPPAKAPSPVDRPWSHEKQWSLVVLDEGPPLPFCGHMRHLWPFPPNSFVEMYRQATPAPSILNQPKLERLMERYAGRMRDLPLLADGTCTNRLNFEPLEQLDVVTGLLDYAGLGEVHTKRLKKLYKACLEKPFGGRLTLRELGKRRDDLLCRQAAPGATRVLNHN